MAIIMCARLCRNDISNDISNDNAYYETIPPIAFTKLSSSNKTNQYIRVQLINGG